MARRATKAWDFCSKCGYRPAMWCGGPERPAYSYCSLCDLELCGHCTGLARLEGALNPSPQLTAWTLLMRLAEDARAQPTLAAPFGRVAVPAAGDGGKTGEVMLSAFVSGPVVRQIVSQGELFVCGAAATAAALNSCTEQLPSKKQRLKLTWKQVLFDHFQDKLKLKVRDADGDPASWKVGKPHIRQVIESFPGMRTRDLITDAEAVPQKREAAWKALVTELRRPNTAVFFHTRNRWSGHYTLIAGAVGPIPADSDRSCDILPTVYDSEHCAILTNQVCQEPMQRVSFEKALEPIVKTKGFFRIFVVEHRPR